MQLNIGYFAPEKVYATGLLVEDLEKMNAVTEAHLQDEVDSFNFLVHGCLQFTRNEGVEVTVAGHIKDLEQIQRWK